jgi:PhnB protein
MSDIKIPPGYQQLMPYLIIKNAGGFSIFTQKVFDAIEINRHMRDNSIIMHAEVRIGDCTIMFADATGAFKPQTSGMFIYVANADETYKKALSEGARSVQEPSDQQYGRSCGVTDPFDNVWWITSVK